MILIYCIFFADLDVKSWIYFNKNEYSSNNITPEQQNLLQKFTLFSMKEADFSEKSEIECAYYKHEKGICVILISEFSKFAINFNGCTDPRFAEENAYKLVNELEDFLKKYSIIIK